MKTPARARLRMLNAKDKAPMTTHVEAGVKSIGKKGATLILKTPFIDGYHVLMDVHNITPKLAELSFNTANSQTMPAVAFLGNIVSFNRVETPEGAHFSVDVVWDEAMPETIDGLKSLKRLVRFIKKPPPPDQLPREDAGAN